MSDPKDYRIIFITHYVELYGANRSLLNLIEGLRSFGWSDVCVVAPCKGALVGELDSKHIPYRIIPFVNETYYTGANPFLLKKIAKFFFNWLIVLRYAGLFKSKKKTLIHSNSSATLIGAYFASFTGCKHIWHIREFGMEDYRFSYNFGYNFFQHRLNKASACIAISKAVYDKRLKESTSAIRRIIYNGVVTLPELKERRKLMQLKVKKDTATIFGIIGHLSPEKGQADAIEALALLDNKNTRMLIAGTGDAGYVNTLQAKVDVQNLRSRVTFTGYIDDTSSFYQSIDCLLMCSKNEGLGRVTIEAMSYGLPVIGYNNAGTAEIIEHEKNGLLYENNASELCLMMQKMIADDMMAKSIRLHAWQTVKEKFTAEKYASSVYEVYESL
jgi:glycosyltransferase involved in cell wall biosynthesis